MKIRNLILGFSLIAAASIQGQNLPELPAKEGFDIRGYVYTGGSDDAKGVAGVKVTDGYTFAVTDENGAYYLKSTPGAKYVSIVLPAGYELPANKVETTGVQTFYEPFRSDDSDYQAYFQIVPHGDDTKFSFLVHADTQPEPYFNSQVYSELYKAYADMKKTAQAQKTKDGFMPLCLHLGDIVYNNANQIRNYRDYLSSLTSAAFGVPMFVIPGNHDRIWISDYDKSMQNYFDTWGPPYYAFERGNFHFIMLDNTIMGEGSYTAGLPGGQLQWVKNYLSMLKKGSQIILCAHQPLTRNKTATNNFAGLLNSLKDFNVTLFTGHLHRQYNNFPTYQENMMERNHVSLGGFEWRSGGVSQDGIPWGYFIYEIDGDNITWKYKPITGEADKNLFRLYTPGQFEDYEPAADEPKTIKVNVWDWDENWSVTWELDGVPQGDLPRLSSAKDPRASYNFDNIPDRPTWEAKATYHIFQCTVPPTGAEVTVTAQDRFGRKMTKTIELDHIVGGLVTISPESCGIESTEIYNLQGVKLHQVAGYPDANTLPFGKGVYLLMLHHTDGTTTTEKAIL